MIKKSFCRYCHAYCPMDVEVQADKVVAVKPDRDNEYYGGYTCVKGRQLVEQMYQEERLTSSHKRIGDELAPIHSDLAVKEIADSIGRIIERYGPRSIATYNGTYSFQNSAQIGFSRAFHDAIGSPSYYTSVTIDQPAKVFCITRHGAWGAGNHMFSDADVALIIGNNPLVSQYAPPGGVPSHSPFEKLREAQKRGLKLLVVDPRRTELASRAHQYLQITPGEDSVLLAGMIKIILDEELHDVEFCQENTRGLEKLAEQVQPFDLNYVANRTGLFGDDILAMTRTFALANKGIAVTGTGPEMSSHPNLTQHLVASLNSLCGRVYRAGDTIPNPGVLCPPAPRYAQAVELPLAWEGGATSRIDSQFGELTAMGFMGPSKEMLTNLLADEILLPGDGQVRALIVVGGNPLAAWPNQEKTYKALKSLDLLVCIDPYLSATSKLADYIIAPKLSLERADVTLLADPFYEEPYSQYTDTVVDTEHDVIEEWELYWGIARELNIEVSIGEHIVPTDRKPSKFEILEMITSGSRVPLSWLRDHPGGHRFPEHQIKAQEKDPETAGMLEFFPAGLDQDFADALEGGESDASYPFRLICSRSKYVLNSSGRNLSMLVEKSGTFNPAFLHPDDISLLGLEDESMIKIESQDGVIPGIVIANKRIKRGVISMYHCWGDNPSDDEESVQTIGSNTNRLLDNRRNNQRYTGVVRQSAIPVRVVAA